jgi:outer membrane receptor protein involved in Fe transport
MSAPLIARREINMTPTTVRSLPAALLFAALALLAFPRGALAGAETTGRISGYVYDPTGAALSEVPLQLSSASAMPVAVTRTTGEDGKFEFDNLPLAEDYSLEVNVPGFTPIKQTGIKVRLGQATPVDVKLAVLTESQAVATFQIIEKVNPVLNPDSVQAGAVITAEKASQTPIFHQVEGMAQQVAGVGPSDGSGRLSTRGGLKRYTKFFIDGMDTTDVSDSGITAPMNFDAVDNFEILTGAMDAQYNSLGTVTNAVTKSGSNRFTYDINVTLGPNFASAKPKFDTTPNPAGFGTYYDNNIPGAATTFYSPIINLGGPIIKDQLWFYASYQQNFSTREVGLNVDNYFQNRNRQTTTSLGRFKLTWQPTSSDRVSAAFNLDRNVINNNDGSAAVAQDAENKLHRGGEFVIFNYDHNFTDNVLFQLSTGITYKAVDTDPIYDDFDTPAHADNGSNTTRFNSSFYSHESKYRFQFDPSISWKLKAAGTHQMKAGFQYSFQSSSLTSGVPGGTIFRDNRFVVDTSVTPDGNSHGVGCHLDPTTNQPDAASLANCFQRTDYFDHSGSQFFHSNSATTSARVNTYGFFAQDRWTVNKQLTVIPGFRVDIGRLAGDDGTLVTTPLLGLGPRLSATFDLFADRKTLLVAHAGRSNDVGNINVAQHGNPALLAVTSNIVGGAFADCNPDPSNPNLKDPKACSVSGGPSGRSFLAAQKPPYVDELSAGVHHEIVAETVFGVDLTYRRYGNMWSDQEVNHVWDASGTKVISNLDGVNHSVLQTVARSDAYRRYAGMDLWVQGTPGRWDLLASYTLSYNWGTIGGDYFDGYLNNPRMAQYFDGWTPDDQRHALKGSIAYRTTFGLDLGARVQFRTGTPLWETFGRNPGDPSQTLYRSPRGTGFPIDSTGKSNTNNPSSWTELRNADFFNIDLQARYNLGEALKLQQKAEIVLLVVNALNNPGPNTYFDTAGNRFAQTNFHYLPIQGEMILRFRN